MEPFLLLCSLHNELLRELSEIANKQFEGLQQAARWYRREGRIDNATTKKISQLDVAYNVARHITRPGTEQFIARIVGSLRVPREDGLAAASGRTTATSPAAGEEDTRETFDSKALEQEIEKTFDHFDEHDLDGEKHKVDFSEETPDYTKRTFDSATCLVPAEAMEKGDEEKEKERDKFDFEVRQLLYPRVMKWKQGAIDNVRQKLGGLLGAPTEDVIDMVRQVLDDGFRDTFYPPPDCCRDFLDGLRRDVIEEVLCDTLRPGSPEASEKEEPPKKVLKPAAATQRDIERTQRLTAPRGENGSKQKKKKKKDRNAGEPLTRGRNGKYITT